MISLLLTDFQGAFKKVDESISVLDPADPALADKLRESIKPLTETKPTAGDAGGADFGDDSEIGKLFEAAPRCKEVKGIAG